MSDLVGTQIVGFLMHRLNFVLTFSHHFLILCLQNRLHESLKLFRGICNNRFFMKSCMVSIECCSADMFVWIRDFNARGGIVKMW